MTDMRKVASGRKGGKTTGQSKNRMKHLTPEQRSVLMQALAKKRYEKKHES